MRKEPAKDEIIANETAWKQEVRAKFYDQPERARELMYGPCEEREYGSNGFLDFFTYCLSPEVLQALGKPLYKSSALEIGYGDGRLLLPAAMVFNKVYGVDIHDMAESTVHNMMGVGRVPGQIHLVDQDFDEIPTRSVDFVWSYYTFQHLAHPDQIEAYIRLMARVMTGRGVASLCYGYCYEDYQGGPFWSKKDAKHVSQVTLRMKRSFMLKIAGKYGMVPLFDDRVTEKPWYSSDHFGQQGRVVFRKV
jgi:SAM-dependent methyltransferase